MSSFAKQLDRRLTRATAAFGLATVLTASPLTAPGPAPTFHADGQSSPTPELMQRAAFGLEQSTRQVTALIPSDTTITAKPTPYTPGGLARMMKALNPVDPLGMTTAVISGAMGVPPLAAMAIGTAASWLTSGPSTHQPHHTKTQTASPSMTPGYHAQSRSHAAAPYQSFADWAMPLIGSNTASTSPDAKLKSALGVQKDYAKLVAGIQSLDDPKQPRVKATAISHDQWADMSYSTRNKFYRDGALTLRDMGVDTDKIGKLKPTMNTINNHFPAFGLNFG